MKRLIINSLFFVTTASFAQKVDLNGEQRFYIETGFVASVVNFTSMNGGGKGDPFGEWSSQVRAGIPLNLVYRNPFCQLGISSTLFAFGTNTYATAGERFFLPNDVKLHLGYNVMSFTKYEKQYIGLFTELGVLNMGWALGTFRTSYFFGVEGYVKNSTKISLGVGAFNAFFQAVPQQKVEKPNAGNSFIVFELSHSFPIRDPRLRK